MKKNAEKYPVGRVLGRSDKYTTYQKEDQQEGNSTVKEETDPKDLK